MPREVTDFAKPLCMTLYVAAARTVAVGDIPKIAALREELFPALDRYRDHEIDEQGVMDVVDQVMGEWTIPPEWQNQLNALGFTRQTPGK